MDRRRLGDPGGLEDHVIGRRPPHDVGDALPEVVLDVDLAAHAAAGELEDVTAATEDQLGIDRDPTELVDEHRELLAVLGTQHAIERGGLAGAEPAREDRERDALHG